MYVLYMEGIIYNSKDPWIPEFNRETLGASSDIIKSYWWPLSDSESRFKAFDVLIDIYRNKEEI